MSLIDSGARVYDMSVGSVLAKCYSRWNLIHIRLTQIQMSDGVTPSRTIRIDVIHLPYVPAAKLVTRFFSQIFRRGDVLDLMPLQQRSVDGFGQSLDVEYGGESDWRRLAADVGREWWDHGHARGDHRQID